MSSTHAHRTAPLDATDPVAETTGTRAPQRDERGATVLEWALIAAVVVVAASIIAAVIFNIIETKSQDLEELREPARRLRRATR